MATNQLLPFASGESPNVLPFADWNSLPARLTGFQSGIASSQQFNYILAQGGAAGYVLGQFVVEYAGQDAGLNAENLYQGFLAALQTLQDTLAPCGMISFFHTTDVPDGWLLCNGALVSRTEYARLFAKIGTKYGAGDGSTTFALPNLDGRVLQGTTSTSKVGQYLEAQLPNISGQIIFSRDNAISAKTENGCFTAYAPGIEPQALYRVGSAISSGAEIGFGANKSSSIYSGDKMQPNSLQVFPCIRF